MCSLSVRKREKTYHYHHGCNNASGNPDDGFEESFLVSKTKEGNDAFLKQERGAKGSSKRPPNHATQGKPSHAL